MTQDEEDVRAASARFYDALNQLCCGNPATMAGIWDTTSHVTTAHPFGDWAHGWEEVWATWKEIAHSARNGSIVARNIRVLVYGTIAYTTCVEDVTVTYGETVVRWSANVTNIFRRIGEEWKMVHHHSDRAPALDAAVNTLVAT